MEASPFLEAAREINGLWLEGLPVSVDLVNCPSDQQVAEVIKRHMKAPVPKGE
jgi:hypothetical protein